MDIFIRIFYIIIWIIISPVMLSIACYKKRDKLWDWAYYFDNDEDGFDGDKLGWYSNYLKTDIDKDRWVHRTWVAYKWSVWRNPCFNLRNHPSVSVDVTNPVNMKYRGNTYFHTRLWHYDKTYKGVLWYWIKAKYEGKSRNSLFFLIPIPFTNKDLYLRFGLKIYPRHYYDKYWLDKISAEGWPESKEKGLTAVSVRIRTNPL